MAIKSIITIHIELSEELDHASHSVYAFHFKICSDFSEAAIWGLSNSLELRLNIWVVASTSLSNPPSKLFVIKHATTITVKLAEECFSLHWFKVAAEGFNRFHELLAVDSSKAFIIEVLEDLPDGSSLILGTVGLLANFF